MVILGIDPGIATTGYGLLNKEGTKLTLLACGAITTPPHQDPPLRLLHISQEIRRLICEYKPETLVTERLFFSRNETTALGVGRTIGVALLAAAENGLTWTEYTPSEVKLAVVGYGNAEKKQVQIMVQRLLGLDLPPKPDDAADAVAIAICHAHSAWMKGQ